MKTPLVTELKPDTELLNPDTLLSLQASEANPLVAIRKILKSGNKILHERFLAQGNVKMIIRRHAWLVDQVLRHLWLALPCSASDDIALLAVGGYGRGELHPNSDIDLLILLRDGNAESVREDLVRFVTQLWDIGLEVGHSVRSLDECVELSSQDITIATNLMEARTIAGNPELTDTMLEATGPAHVWPADAFFDAKWKEQIARHHKHNNTENNLEPDVKSAPGGLRDIQTIGWVAKRYFGVNRLSELVEKEFLTNEEYALLNEGQAFLWEVRYALHLITKRSENRLLFDYQRSVAEMLGYRDSNIHLAVETFMKRYYRVALSISQLNEMLLQLFDEAILNADQVEQITPINKRFQLRNGLIEAVHARVFQRTPSALMEIFVILAQNDSIQGIRASTIRLIRDNRHLIDDAFRNDLTNITLFLELLRSPHQLFTQLTRMNRYGILGAYLPLFGQVIGQMQYDLFHQYTVDAHTLLVLKNMRKFRYVGSEQEFPVASFIFHRLPKIELLYLAGLFHDLGKGKGGDHSEIGAKEAYNFCLHHRLSRWDAQLVSWLVRHHLLMSMTAQKKDVSDPDIISDFARKVGDQVHLDYLYALTVADICATNPNLWNGWRSSLLRQLYTEARRVLRRGVEIRINKQDWIEETRERARKILAHRKLDPDAIDDLWEQLGEDYFLRESPGDVARHTEAILNHGDNHEPLVLIGKTDERIYEGATQVFIYAPDRPNLFAVTAAVMNQLNLTIADAKVLTSNTEFSLDTYIVMEADGTDITEPERLTQIKSKLQETLSTPEKYPEVVHKRMPRALKHFDVPTNVVISNDIVQHKTVVEINALDRPGLLAEIGRIFMEMQVVLSSARVSTLGERVEDVFYIVDAEGQPIRDPVLCETLKQKLITRLDSNGRNS